MGCAMHFARLYLSFSFRSPTYFQCDSCFCPFALYAFFAVTCVLSSPAYPIWFLPLLIINFVYRLDRCDNKKLGYVRQSPSRAISNMQGQADALTPKAQRVAAGETYFYREHRKPQVETSYRIRVISGTANYALSESVAKYLKVDLCRTEIKRFANGELNIKVVDDVRGDDCFILQPIAANEHTDINTAMMELLLLVHTLKLSSAKRITAIVPYFAYSRQDRKTEPRVPISASAVAQLLQCMGVDRVVTVDLHCGQIQGFFRNMPVDNLLMFPEFATYVMRQPWFDRERTVVVSPDAGGVERANVLADRIGASHIVTILKRRSGPGKVDSMQTVGNVEGYTCVIVDDIVDTAGTLCKACELLRDMGALRLVACATHGILTDPACERISQCDALTELVVSDSIAQNINSQKCNKLTVLTIAPLLVQAIYNLHFECSLSSLFRT
ncbi:phosphoribosylpyrophosphate synthetase, putative [Trypanosoma brucei brucei TREU927]|uniref:ribose-phosphate diphosphokinase n=1 Tax=Trypanosoma brucei brucei (strain 927/4 GUTat10.1) TaxID=185431 RepID=Q386K8_TRYB2|nr:phosphoribosylpyrophosphate synthetase, putative [Trypanosoma brucei brucei TREU927]EAN79273.1 phosphoribosylpyrophosphate synthetase, putative [Trypanosoma brucei brucei TREU927]